MNHRFAIIVLFLFSNGQAIAEEVRQNVLFIAIDDLRNDLGSLGVAHARTRS